MLINSVSFRSKVENLLIFFMQEKKEMNVFITLITLQKFNLSSSSVSQTIFSFIDYVDKFEMSKLL